MTQRSFLARIVALLFLAVSCQTLAVSQTLLEDDFESYPDDTALDAVWPRAGNATTNLAADPDDSANAVLYSKGDRRHRSFDPVTPTDDHLLYLRVKFYDDYQVGVPGREYVGLWAAPFSGGPDGTGQA